MFVIVVFDDGNVAVCCGNCRCLELPGNVIDFVVDDVDIGYVNALAVCMVVNIRRNDIAMETMTTVVHVVVTAWWRRR